MLAGYIARRRGKRVNQHHFVVDAFGDDGWLQIGPETVAGSCMTVRAIPQILAGFG
jgi:hypothetical protein